MPEICERDVESYLVARVKEAGGEIRKVKWIGRNGAPDRGVLLYGSHFVEVKRPGQWLEPHQQREHDRMRAQGASVHVVDSRESVDEFIAWVMRKAGFAV